MKHKLSTFLFKSCLLILVGLTLPQGLVAQQTRAGAAYLKILPGTRQQGVYGSMTAGLDESFSIYSNPAATGLLREWQFAFSYTKWIANINNASIFAGKRFGLSTPFGRNIYAGLGVNNQAVYVQSTYGRAPSANTSDLLVTGTIGLPLDKIFKNLSIGANVKYLRSNLDVSSVNALIYDAGLLYRTERFKFPLLPFDGIFSLGGSVNHWGKSLKYEKLKTPLPMIYRLGAGLNLGTHDGLQVQLVGDFRRVRDEVDQFGIGAEFINFASALPGLDNTFGRLLTFRVGWLRNNEQDKNILNELSYGLSVNLDDFMNYRAKAGGGGFAPNNSSWRMDMAYQDNASKTGNVSNFGWTLFPNAPEAFEFALDDEFMTTDVSDTSFYHYELGDTIEFAWQATRDPDLYDNTNYVMLVSNNRSELEELLQSSLFASPQDTMDKVEYHPVKDSFKPAQLRGSFIDKNENHISCSVNGGNIQLFYFFPHQIKTEKFADLSNLLGKIPNPVRANTFTFSKEENQFKYKQVARLDTCNYSGDFYWSVIAFDKNSHQRVINGKKSSIAHYKVIGRPDLTINITRTDSVFSAKPDTFSLRNVHFAFGRADTSDLYQASKDSLKGWVKKLNSANYDSILVYGYTDTTGSTAINQQLSQARAESIVKYLINHGVNSLFFRPIGFGEEKMLPRRPNEPYRDWTRRNRRVKLEVIEEPPPRKFYADVVVKNNSGSVNNPKAFTAKVYKKTTNFIEKPPQVAGGNPVELMTPFEVDITDGANAVLVSKVPGLIEPGLEVLPNLNEFRFDTLSSRVNTTLVPVDSFNLGGIGCNQTQSFRIEWNEENRFLVAVVDQANDVDELDELNNWDIEQLVDTDLEIKEKRGTVIPLRIAANFKTGSPVLTNAAQQNLLKAPLDELKLAFDTPKFQNTYLEVGGHTDDQGTDAINIPLSFKRAKWIKNFLVQKFQLDSTRISAVGYGGTKPIHDSVSFKYPKSSPSWINKQKDNRRIELRWLQKNPAGVPPDRICTKKICLPNDPPVRAAFVGQEIEYKIVVKNLSKEPAFGAEVIDILPQHLKFKRGSEKSTAKSYFSAYGDKLKWTFDIEGGVSDTLKYTVFLDKSIGNRIENLTNNVSVSTQLDYNLANNKATDTITGIGNTAPKLTIHDVQCGETLGTIAAMYYGNVADYPRIQAANNMGISDVIKPGQKLKIFNPKAFAKINPGNVEISLYQNGNEFVGFLKSKVSGKAIPVGDLIYRWKRDGVIINNCAAYYTQQTDGGKTLTFEIIDKITGKVLGDTTIPVIPMTPPPPPEPNKPPSVTNVTIKGSRCVGDSIEVDYKYEDPEEDLNKSEHQLFRGDSLITTTKKKTYPITIDDVGCSIKFVVVPSDGFAKGKPVGSQEVKIPNRVEDDDDCKIENLY